MKHNYIKIRTAEFSAQQYLLPQAIIGQGILFKKSINNYLTTLIYICCCNILCIIIVNHFFNRLTPYFFNE